MRIQVAKGVQKRVEDHFIGFILSPDDAKDFRDWLKSTGLAIDMSKIPEEMLEHLERFVDG